MSDLYEVLDVEEASKYLRCSAYTVEGRARSGDLPASKFGDSWIFPRAAFFERVNEIAKTEAMFRRAKAMRPAAVAKGLEARGPVKLPDLH